MECYASMEVHINEFRENPVFKSMHRQTEQMIIHGIKLGMAGEWNDIINSK